MIQKKATFSNNITVIVTALLLFLPTLAYGLSQASEDNACLDTAYTVAVEPTKDCLAPSNFSSLLLDAIKKDTLPKTKSLWVAYILDNQLYRAYLDLRVKATENNLEPPKNLKLFLISHYISKRNDLFL